MPSPSASASFVVVEVGVGLLLVAELGADDVAPGTGDEAALPEGGAAVGDVVDVDEHPVAATATSRATAMARGLMVRVWSTCSVPEELGGALVGVPFRRTFRCLAQRALGEVPQSRATG